MKINNIKNLEEFFAIIDQCVGKVELVSKEGDRINMKSKLSQFVAMAKLFTDDSIINELELLAYNQDDIELLLKYMINHD